MEAWHLIESDPGIFTTLLNKMGAINIKAEEVFGLDENFIPAMGQVYGLIFCHKYLGLQPNNDNQNEISGTLKFDIENIFFAKQIISNACATQALISILFNHPLIELNDNLLQLKEFSKDFPPDLKGELIGSTDFIREAHNSMAGIPMDFINRWYQDLQQQNQSLKESQDLFHFTAFVPIHGHLFELDGLKEAPIDFGPIQDDNWVSKAFQILKDRINSYNGGELRFNLLSLTHESDIEIINNLIKDTLKRIEMDSYDHLPLILELLAKAAKSGKLAKIIDNVKRK